MGEARARHEAIVRGEPDPGIRGFKNTGRRSTFAKLAPFKSLEDGTKVRAQTECGVLPRHRGGISFAFHEQPIPRRLHREQNRGS